MRLLRSVRLIATLAAASATLALTAEANRFPNYFAPERFYAGQSSASQPTSAQVRAELEKAMKQVLHRVQMPVIAPGEREPRSTYVFRELPGWVGEKFPGTKLYLGGSAVRYLTAYLYRRVYFEMMRDPKQVPASIIRRVAAEEAPISRDEVLGVASDTDLFYDPSRQRSSSGFDSWLKRLFPSTQTQTVTHQQGRLFQVVVDAKERIPQTDRALAQGGVSIDWTVFDIDDGKVVNGSPKMQGDPFDDVIRGILPYRPISSSGDMVTRARLLRPLFEMPQVQPSSLDAYLAELRKLREHLMATTRIDPKIPLQFEKMTNNMFPYGVMNRFTDGTGGSIEQEVREIAALLERKSPNGIKLNRFLPYSPSVTPTAPAVPILEAAKLTPEQIKKVLPEGKVFHGTDTFEKATKIVRGGFILSDEDLGQGRSLDGPGTYFGRTEAESREYAKSRGIILSFPIDPEWRILDWGKVDSATREAIAEQARAQGKPLEQHLADAHGFDFILRGRLRAIRSNRLPLFGVQTEILRSLLRDFETNPAAPISQGKELLLLASALGIETRELAEMGARILRRLSAKNSPIKRNDRLWELDELWKSTGDEAKAVFFEKFDSATEDFPSNWHKSGSVALEALIARLLRETGPSGFDGNWDIDALVGTKPGHIMQDVIRMRRDPDLMDPKFLDVSDYGSPVAKLQDFSAKWPALARIYVASVLTPRRFKKVGLDRAEEWAFDVASYVSNTKTAVLRAADGFPGSMRLELQSRVLLNLLKDSGWRPYGIEAITETRRFIESEGKPGRAALDRSLERILRDVSAIRLTELKWKLSALEIAAGEADKTTFDRIGESREGAIRRLENGDLPRGVHDFVALVGETLYGAPVGQDFMLFNAQLETGQRGLVDALKASARKLPETESELVAELAGREPTRRKKAAAALLRKIVDDGREPRDVPEVARYFEANPKEAARILVQLAKREAQAKRAPAAAAVQPFEFFVDIDHTLVEQPVPPGTPPARVLKLAADGQTYLIREGAPELIASLKRFPGARISFFSAGSDARNRELLSKITLPNGTQAIENVRVLTPDDLVPAKDRESLFAPFKGEADKDKKKALERWVTSLDRAILIDDHPTYAAGGQERNLLWVGRDRTPPKRTLQSAIPLRKVRGLLEVAYRRSLMSGKPLPDELFALQWKEGSEPGVYEYRKDSLELPEVEKLGEESFKGLEKPLPSAAALDCAVLLPLDRSRRLGRDVVDHSVDAADLVADARRHPRQELVLERIPVRRHAVA